jgi:hypothetical protein
METSLNESAPHRLNPFLADLAQAMRSTAETARVETTERCREEAKAYVEQLQARKADDIAAFRAASDADVQSIRERSKAQVDRVRVETEERVSRRRELLAQGLAQYASAVELEVQRVQERVEAFQIELTKFFEQLLEGGEADPTVFANMASRMPGPPDFDLDHETIGEETNRNGANGHSSANGQSVATVAGSLPMASAPQAAPAPVAPAAPSARPAPVVGSFAPEPAPASAAPAVTSAPAPVPAAPPAPVVASAPAPAAPAPAPAPAAAAPVRNVPVAGFDAAAANRAPLLPGTLSGAGAVRGRLYSEWYGEVERLRAIGDEAGAVELLLDIVAGTEAESRAEGGPVAPQAYEELAVIYRSRDDITAEFAILERFARQEKFAHQQHAPGEVGGKLLDRWNTLKKQGKR